MCIRAGDRCVFVRVIQFGISSVYGRQITDFNLLCIRAGDGCVFVRGTDVYSCGGQMCIRAGDSVRGTDNRIRAGDKCAFVRGTDNRIRVGDT